ncbi:MAG: helix-turn-helix transcriptional regulator [Cyanobacteria bacterium]|nr:helix-turn-helix transcriptional regulator [Cyanobacteriota bacterium]MDW8199818.1 helix-turn-helix transcriptional regulator [Cyanobacteriota bacterium SKYGB_h_bin112]
MTSQPYCQQLQMLMQQAGISSLRSLSRQAGVSLWQVRQVQAGNLHNMRLAVLQALSRALRLSLADFLSAFGASTPDPQPQTDQPPAMVSRQEYDRLHQQLNLQRELLTQELQRHSLDTLESLLVQLPTARYAATHNPQLPAKNVLLLLTPLDRLLTQWGLAYLDAVGDEVPYDPQRHQLTEGSAQPGDRVKVRYAGYAWRGNLLRRSQVTALVTRG